MLKYITHNLLWSAGLNILLTIIAVTVVSYFLLPRSGWYLVLFFMISSFIFSFYFFRNPERHCPALAFDPTVLICPADGVVVDVQHSPENNIEGYSYKISIFLSPLDVHVNWLPVTGLIKSITYHPGKFMLAWLPKSSYDNEHNDVVVTRADGTTLLVRQIAGFVARRICWWIKENDTVNAGYKYGMIRFGSRVDLLLPATTEVMVKVDERVYGGQTVIGRIPWHLP
jgi:phosphatidylserine decarboxylase